MINRKLLEVIRCLSPEEEVRLQQFVSSPYMNNKFNKSKTLQLLDHLLTLKPQLDHPQLEKAWLNQHFFPEAEFKANGKNAIDSLASDLFDLTRRFIYWEEVNTREQKVNQQLALARFYRNNNLEERYWATIRQVRKKHHQQIDKNDQYFLDAFFIEEEIATFLSIFNEFQDDANLINAHQHIDHYYITTKLEMACLLKYQQQQIPQLDVGDALHMSNVLIRELTKCPSLQTPLNNIYIQILELLEKPDDQLLLAAFEEACHTQRAHIPPSNYRTLMVFYRYFIGRKYQHETQGNALIFRIFELYKAHLKEGYFHVQGKKILTSSLKTIVNIALKAKAYAWADELLKTYTPERIMGTRFPAEFHGLCQAEVHFAMGTFEAAHDQLVYTSFEDTSYSIMADILLIKIYYATQHELLGSRVRALEQKVRRSKLVAIRKESYLNFLKTMYKVMKYEPLSSSKQWRKLHDYVKSTTPMVAREWLLREVFN